MNFNLIPGIDSSSSGIEAQRKRMEAAASNMANADTTIDKNGNGYRPLRVEMKPSFQDELNGETSTVKSEMVPMNDEIVEEYAPEHPNADENGMIRKPKVSPIREMMDMISATRSYEANLSVMRQSKDMAEATIARLKG